MKQRLFFLAWLLALMTTAHAADGTLSVSNVKNAVPGYTGSLDIVLSGSDNIYEAFQFSIILPDGLSFVSVSAGELCPASYNVDATAMGSNTTQILCYDTNATPLTAKNGVLVTIKFSVDGSTSVGEQTGGQLVSINAPSSGSHDLPDVDFSITTTDVVILDENATEAPSAISDAKVKVNRTLKADVWNTICLPFAISASQVTAAFGAGTEIGLFKGYELNGENITVNFDAVTAMEAHTPYIIKVSATLSSFTVEGTSITELGVNEEPVVAYGETKGSGKNTHYEANDMVGTYVAETVIPDYALFLSNNTFMFSKGNSKLKAYRAYFDFYDAEYDAESRTFTILFDDFTTAVNGVRGRMGATSGDLYNLSGQRIAHPSKGLYIQRGQKVVIK